MSTAQPPMSGPDAGSPSGGQRPGRDRRGWERYSFGSAQGKLIYAHAAMPCRFVDISLGGCCVRTEKRFAAGALAKVEVLFDLHGAPQRIAGITQWTGKGNELGIRFVHATPQDKNQFAALLIGLIDETAAEAVKEAVASTAIAPAVVAGARIHPEPAPAGSVSLSQPLPADEPLAVEFAQGESQAVIRFLKDGLQIAGTVVDLSLESCTLQLVRPFTLGIYVRVEISFHIRGLTFQLAGVSQEIYDRHTVGFRFLDVSRRRREELTQAIEEMRTARERP